MPQLALVPDASAEDKILIDQLIATRRDYGDERVWHRFLLDGYAGTGGFRGKVRMPLASYWGAGADMYSANEYGSNYGDDESRIDTYLDRFTREDVRKFERRVNVSSYPNYIAPIVDIRLSYLNRKGFTRDLDGAPAVAEWMQDVDGRGTGWDTLRRDVIEPRAAVLGWCPCLIDLDPVPAGIAELTVAQASALRIRPRVLPLFPGHLLDWSIDQAGAFNWVKVRVDFVERATPFEDERQVSRVTIWRPDVAQVWEIVTDQQNNQSIRLRGEERPHPFGEVPIVAFRNKPVPDDALIKGIPMAGDLTTQARRLFNVLSELDEHLRTSAFAMLQVPTDDPDGLASMTIGSHNAVAVPLLSSKDYKWITPDSSVADVLEKRASTIIQEIYRQGRVEFTRAGAGGSGSAQSGISRAFEFENTNRSIADTAANFARGEEKLLRLVSRALPGNIDENSIRITAPQKFDVEELAKEIAETMDAVTLDLGPTANAELKKRLVQKLLSNIEDDTLEEIYEEIDERAEAADEAAEAMRSMSVELAENPNAGSEASDEEASDDGSGPPSREKPSRAQTRRPSARAASK